jgi:hypothetical protein
MKTENLAILIELFVESQNSIDIILKELVGDPVALGYNDGLFGKISKLSKVIRGEIDSSYINEANLHDEYADSKLYKILYNDEYSSYQKAIILNQIKACDSDNAIYIPREKSNVSDN